MKNTGFSLVELLVVIAIMAVLAGVAVPTYSHFVDEAHKGKDNDYMAEIYRLTFNEAAMRGLTVNRVVVALEDDGAANTPDFNGRLAMIDFVESTVDENVKLEIIEAVWQKTTPYQFKYDKYYAWADTRDDVQGVYYDRTSSGQYPYTVDVYGTIEDVGGGETTKKPSGLDLPSIPL